MRGRSRARCRRRTSHVSEERGRVADEVEAANKLMQLHDHFLCVLGREAVGQRGGVLPHLVHLHKGEAKRDVLQRGELLERAAQRVSGMELLQVGLRG